MDKIPKYKTKNNESQGYIKVTKKETLDKTITTNNNNNYNMKIKLNNNNNNSKKISQKKLKFSYQDSIRKFGDDISNKIKSAISSNITHYHQNRKSLSNIDEKVNYFFIYYFFNIYRFL